MSSLSKTQRIFTERNFRSDLSNCSIEVVEIIFKYLIQICALSSYKIVDALVTLASKIDILDETVDVQIMKRTSRATATDIFPDGLVNVYDWRSSITQNQNKPSIAIVVKKLKEFVVMNDELYDRGSG